MKHLFLILSLIGVNSFLFCESADQSADGIITSFKISFFNNIARDLNEKIEQKDLKALDPEWANVYRFVQETGSKEELKIKVENLKRALARIVDNINSLKFADKNKTEDIINQIKFNIKNSLDDVNKFKKTIMTTKEKASKKILLAIVESFNKLLENVNNKAKKLTTQGTNDLEDIKKSLQNNVKKINLSDLISKLRVALITIKEAVNAAKDDNFKAILAGDSKTKKSIDFIVKRIDDMNNSLQKKETVFVENIALALSDQIKMIQNDINNLEDKTKEQVLALNYLRDLYSTDGVLPNMIYQISLENEKIKNER